MTYKRAYIVTASFKGNTIAPSARYPPFSVSTIHIGERMYDIHTKTRTGKQAINNLWAFKGNHEIQEDEWEEVSVEMIDIAHGGLENYNLSHNELYFIEQVYADLVRKETRGSDEYEFYRKVLTNIRVPLAAMHRRPNHRRQ